MSDKIIAFVNSKGGVGKTTLLLRLAGCLSRAGHRVLTVDNDSRGHLTRLFQFDESTLLNEHTDISYLYQDHDHPPFERVIHATRYRNLFLIPSTVRLVFYNDYDVPPFPSPYPGLQKCIDHVQDRFDIILIDCPAWNSSLNVTALAAANTVLLPARPCDLGIMDLRKTLEFVGDVRSQFNPGLACAGIVITMRDPDSEVHAKYEEYLRTIGSDLIFPSAIPLSTSFDHEPFVDPQGRMGFGHEKAYDPSPDIEAFANELLRRIGSPFRVSQGKLSITDDASSAGTSSERPEALPTDETALPQPVEVELDYEVGC